jgi:hypothetical protein
MVNRNDLDALAESIAGRNSQALAELKDHIIRGMNTNTKETQEELSKVTLTVNDLGESLTQIQKEIKEVKLMVETRMTVLEKRISEVEKKGPVEDPLTLMHQEIWQLNIRKNNVVIHGLKEGERDYEQANEFLTFRYYTESGKGASGQEPSLSNSRRKNRRKKFSQMPKISRIKQSSRGSLWLLT